MTDNPHQDPVPHEREAAGLLAVPLDTAAVLEALAEDVAALVAAREEDQARLRDLEAQVDVLARAVLRLENHVMTGLGGGHDGSPT